MKDKRAEQLRKASSKYYSNNKEKVKEYNRSIGYVLLDGYIMKIIWYIS